MRRRRLSRWLGGLFAALLLVSAFFSRGDALGERVETVTEAVQWAVPDMVQNTVQEVMRSAWQRAVGAARGPVRVGLQVGHENAAAHPEELARLRQNTGGHANGVDEVDLNRAVAEALREQLEAHGVTVDLLSATPPRGYYADLVLSLHADSVADPTRRGYKSAVFEPERNPFDAALKGHIDRAYFAVSGFPDDHHNTTQNMHRYYALQHVALPPQRPSGRAVAHRGDGLPEQRPGHGVSEPPRETGGGAKPGHRRVFVGAGALAG